MQFWPYISCLNSQIKKNPRQKGIFFKLNILSTHSSVLSSKKQLLPHISSPIVGFENFCQELHFSILKDPSQYTLVQDLSPLHCGPSNPHILDPGPPAPWIHTTTTLPSQTPPQTDRQFIQIIGSFYRS